MSQMSEPFLYNYNTSTTSLLHWAYCYFVDDDCFATGVTRLTLLKPKENVQFQRRRLGHGTQCAANTWFVLYLIYVVVNRCQTDATFVSAQSDHEQVPTYFVISGLQRRY